MGIHNSDLRITFVSCFRAHYILIAHFSCESPPRKEEDEHEQPKYGEVTL